MWILMLEAAAAALVFVFIVWWTMFCDRPKDGQPDQPEPGAQSRKDTPEQEKPGATVRQRRTD